jgi:4-amino-4-deoxy-L-arabinose transferase-like glycosyltransferase
MVYREMTSLHDPEETIELMTRTKRILAVILLAFVILGFVYSLVTPIFEASDEVSHYPVVKYIADGHGLPVQDPDAEGAWEQEGSQPPLYYALAAALTHWIDTNDLPEVRWRNPLSNIGNPLRSGNKNLIMHTQTEAFPWHGATLAVHLIRVLSVLLQACTVFLTFMISWKIWPERPELGLLAAALVAFNPMFLFIAGSVNNDNLIVPLATLVVFLLIHILKAGQPSTRQVGLLGLLLGLIALTKLSGLGLIALSVLVLAAVAWRRRAWGAWLRWVTILGAIVVLIAGWWYLRNWRLYGDPTGLNAMLEAAGRRKHPFSWRQWLNEFEGFRMSFWGVFGGFNLVGPNWVYQLYDALTAAAAVGLGVLAWQHRASWRGQRVQLGLVLVGWVAIILLSLLRWTSQTLASQGRLIFPAIAVISVLFAYGLAGWAGRAWRQRIAVAVGGVAFVLAVAMPFWVISPAYAKPPLLSADQVPASAQKADLIFANTLRLMAYELPQTTIHPGEQLPVKLYWQSIASTPTDKNYTVYTHLLGRGLRPIGQVNTYPGQGAYPTSLLKPGHVVQDDYLVPVEISATTPSLVRVQAGLFEYGVNNDAPFPAVDSQGEPARSIIGTVRLLPDKAPTYTISQPTRFDLGDRAALLGYDLGVDDAAVMKPGETITMTLYWQAQTRMSEDYQVFVHLVGPKPETRMVAQGDRSPLDGDWPTSAWEPGYPVRDAGYAVTLPAALPPGTYDLRVGLYRLGDGWRIPVQGPAGRVEDSAAILTSIEVR